MNKDAGKVDMPVGKIPSKQEEHYDEKTGGRKDDYDDRPADEKDHGGY